MRVVLALAAVVAALSLAVIAVAVAKREFNGPQFSCTLNYGVAHTLEQAQGKNRQVQRIECRAH